MANPFKPHDRSKPGTRLPPKPQPTPASGVAAVPGSLPFDKWPQSTREAYEALEKHLENGPSFPLALLMQIRVQLSDGVGGLQK